jgi:hypothetical protein
MPMVDLKRSAKELKADMSADYKPDPYTVRMHLDGEDVKNLGMSGVQVGDKRMMTCEVEVCGMNASQYEGGEKYESVTLKVMKAEVSGVEKSDEEKAARLYTTMKS